MSEVGKVEVFDNLDTSKLWHLKAINVEKMWKHTKGEGVKVVVIDSGIDINHPELADSFVSGQETFTNSLYVRDDYGHGTHVAGTIVGKNVGIAPEAELYVVKALNHNGQGSMKSVSDALTYANSIKADVVCLSLGVEFNLPAVMTEKIYSLSNKGAVVVSAVGNRRKNKAEYPANTDSVLGVGGLNEDLVISEFSNFGEGLDVVAPSVDIFSSYINGQYAKMTGTSMASPIVAGIVALIISYCRLNGVKFSRDMLKKIIEDAEGEPLRGGKFLNFSSLDIDKHKK